MTQCASCSSSLRGGEKFCGNCGAPCSLVEVSEPCPQVPSRPVQSNPFESSISPPFRPQNASIPASTPPVPSSKVVPATSLATGRIPTPTNLNATKSANPSKPVQSFAEPKFTNITSKEFRLTLEMAKLKNQAISQPFFACTASRKFNWVIVGIPLYFNIMTAYLVITQSELVLADKTLWKGLKAVVSIPWSSISMCRFVIRAGILASNLEITFLDGKSVNIPIFKRYVAEEIREHVKQVKPSVRIL